MNYVIRTSSEELYHHGILGQKWGIRRFQNPDGTLTEEGKKMRAIAKAGIKIGASMAIGYAGSQMMPIVIPASFAVNTAAALSGLEIVGKTINSAIGSIPVDQIAKTSLTIGKTLVNDVILPLILK